MARNGPALILHSGCSSTGVRRVEMLGPVYLHSVLLLSGPAISVWVCGCVCVCVCVCVCERERERESVSVSVSVSFVFLPLPFLHKVVAF